MPVIHHKLFPFLNIQNCYAVKTGKETGKTVTKHTVGKIDIPPSFSQCTRYILPSVVWLGAKSQEPASTVIIMLTQYQKVLTVV